MPSTTPACSGSGAPLIRKPSTWPRPIGGYAGACEESGRASGQQPWESDAGTRAGAAPGGTHASALLSAHEQGARELPLRRDVEAFLAYLRDHPVTGTSASGNLPLKAVAEFAALMSTPPRLEEEVGDRVFRFRSEEEVWPVHFIHILAGCAGLVSGGAGRRWRLTHPGEAFPSRPAAEQLLALLDGWWYRANWLVATHFATFGEELPPQTPARSWPCCGDWRWTHRAAFPEFVDEFVQTIGLSYPGGDNAHVRDLAAASVEGCVIRPLSRSGLLRLAGRKWRAAFQASTWTGSPPFSHFPGPGAP